MEKIGGDVSSGESGDEDDIDSADELASDAESEVAGPAKKDKVVNDQNMPAWITAINQKFSTISNIFFNFSRPLIRTFFCSSASLRCEKNR